MLKLKKTASLLAALSLSFGILLTGYAVNADPVNTDISVARGEVGQTVTVTGVVTKSIQSSASNTNNNTIFIQDSTGGIGVYKSGSFDVSSYAGDEIRVTGTVSSYNGQIEIQPADLTDTNVHIVETGVQTPNPVDITLADLNAGTDQGQLVKVSGVTITAEGTSSNHTITQNGVSATLRAPFATNLPSYNVGDVVDITGIASVYGSTKELMVQSESDIVIHEASAPVIEFITPVTQTANTTPAIEADYSATGGVNTDTVQYSLKEKVSGKSVGVTTVTPTGSSVTFSPVEALDTGITYTAAVTATSVGGDTATQTYDFTVVAPQAISAVRALTPDIGTVVSVKGVVTRSIKSSASVGNNDTVFIRDARDGQTGLGQNDGIGIYKSYSFVASDYPAGTVVTVTGVLSSYNGLLEIVPDTVAGVEKLGTTAAPAAVTVANLSDLGNWQGQFVEVGGASDVTLTAIGTNSNHTITQTGGVSLTLRDTGDTTLTQHQVGNTVRVDGIAGIYSGAAQLLVQSEADIH